MRIIQMCLVLYAFALLQMSFFVHFLPEGIAVNLIFPAVLFIAVFERAESSLSIAAAVFGGLLIDAFSETVFGFWPLILVAIVITVKLILENYVRLPIPKKF